MSDVRRDGQLWWIAGGTSGWLSLDGIRFAKQQGQLLTAGPGWRSYSEVNNVGMYKLLSATKNSNRVLLSGLLLRQDCTIAPGQVLTTLPAGMRPAQPRACLG